MCKLEEEKSLVKADWLEFWDLDRGVLGSSLVPSPLVVALKKSFFTAHLFFGVLEHVMTRKECKHL